jgi:hypothetical protein
VATVGFTERMAGGRFETGGLPDEGTSQFTIRCRLHGGLSMANARSESIVGIPDKGAGTTPSGDLSTSSPLSVQSPPLLLPFRGP